MIIREEIVKPWFQTSHPVYKNFAYLFDNPLWTKKVPRGFTVCPYFWMSMFSLFVFRPIVMLITHIILPVVAFGGKPLLAYDEFVGSKFTLARDHEDRPIKGVGIVITGIALVVGIALYTAWVSYMVYIAILPAIGIYSFWVIVASVIIAIALTRVPKHLVLLIPWFILVLGGYLVVFPVESFCFIGEILGFVKHGIFSIGSWIVYAAAWLVKSIGILLFEVVKAGWVMLWWVPIKALLLPWWGYLVLYIGITHVLFDQLFKYIDSTRADVINQNPAELDAAQRIRQAELIQSQTLVWTSSITRMFFAFKSFKRKVTDSIENYLIWNREQFNLDGLNRSAIIYFAYYQIAVKLVESHSKELVDALVKAGVPTIHYLNRIFVYREDSIGSGGIDYAFMKLIEHVEKHTGKLDYTSNLGNQLYKFASTQNYSSMIADLATNMKNYDNIIIKAVASERAAAKRRLAAANPSKFSLCCGKMTTIVERYCTNKLTIYRARWKVIKGIYGRVKKNLLAFCMYCKMLIKARKDKACPYFVFEEPPK